MKDLQDIVHELKGKSVALRATEQPVDTGTAAGKAFLDMLGVFAKFETNLRRERQLEGIKAAKARGITSSTLCTTLPPSCSTSMQGSCMSSRCLSGSASARPRPRPCSDCRSGLRSPSCASRAGAG